MGSWRDLRKILRMERINVFQDQRPEEVVFFPRKAEDPSPALRLFSSAVPEDIGKT